ncbi:putative NmrA-like domain-containing protein [Seiridium cardinale]
MADTEAEGDRKKAIDGIINRSEREPSVGIVFATHGPGTKPEIKPPAPLCVLPTDWSSNTLALSDRLVTKKECTVLLRLRSGTKVVFHNGGDNAIGPSTLPDIATAIVKIIDHAHLEETANQPIYIYSAAVSERQLTRLAVEVTGIDFGGVEGGRIADLDVDRMVKEADDKFARGDNSGWFSYFFQMMYGKGYGGTEFRDLAWNKRLALRVMDEADLRLLIQRIAKSSSRS